MCLSLCVCVCACVCYVMEQFENESKLVIGRDTFNIIKKYGTREEGGEDNLVEFGSYAPIRL